MAYFIQLTSQPPSKASSITADVGEESEEFALVAEPSDPRAAAMWPYLSDKSLADIEVIDANQAKFIPAWLNRERDRIFTVTGKRSGNIVLEARDLLESRTDIYRFG